MQSLAQRSCGLALWMLACSEPTPNASAPSPPAQDRSPCAALCAHLDACGPAPDFPGVDACTKTCEEDPRQEADPCRDPRLAYERCVTALPCDQVRARNDLDVAKTGPCGAETRAVIACEPESPAEPFIYFQF